MAVFEIATFSTLAKLLLAARKLATDPDPLNRAKALADLAENGKALTAAITGVGLSKLAQEMETRANSIDSYLTHEGTAKDDARLIFWQVASYALADPDHVTGTVLDPKAATDALVTTIHASPLGRDFRQTSYAEDYFRQVITGTLEVMLAEKGYIDSITPALWRHTLQSHGIQIELLREVKSDTEEILAIVRDLHRTKQADVPECAAC